MARRWSNREDVTLTRLYRAGTPVREIARELGRSEDAVNVRRRDLGIDARRARWSPREDALLGAASQSRLPAAIVAEQLGRPVSQVRWRRRALGLTSAAPARYRPEEDAALRRVFARGEGLAALAERLGRTPDALHLRAASLGLHRPVPRRRWSASEDAAIRDGYDSGLSCAEIARELRGRSAAGVAGRAAKLGLATHARRWTAADDERLRRHARSHRLEDLARLLGRTPDALRQRARKLDVALLPESRCRRANVPWSAEEDEFLRMHPGLNPSTIADMLGRSDRAITIRLAKLGLREGRERSPHRRTTPPGRFMPGEEALLRQALGTGDPRRLLVVARRLGISAAMLPLGAAPAAARRERDATMLTA